MRSITKLINFKPAVLILLILVPCLLSAQNKDKVNLDSLLTGGIYKVMLTDGKVFTAELMYETPSEFYFNSDENTIMVRKTDIKSVFIAGKKNIEYSEILSDNIAYSKPKIKNTFSVYAGISFPIGTLGENVNTGFTIGGSYFDFLSRYTGFNYEFQITHLPSIDFTIEDKNNYYNSATDFSQRSESHEGGSINLFKPKFSFLFGSFTPESNLLYYGIIGIGIGLGYQSEINDTYKGHVKTQYYENSYNYTYTFESSNRFDFNYALGVGAAYKINKRNRILLSVEYNSTAEYDYYYGYTSSGIDGLIFVKAGLMF